MRNPTTPVTDGLYDYILAHTVRPHPVLAALRDETLKLPNAHWATTPDQVAFLQFLVRLLGARRIVEVGTFTGYATLGMALAQPEDGMIVTCDVASGWSEMGTHYWREAKLDRRIERRTGRADEILAELRDADGASSQDLIFLDGNKASYPVYIDLAADLLRPGGVLVADDIFWEGKVADPGQTGEQLAGIREFNERLASDARFDIAMIPVADGMTLARKK